MDKDTENQGPDMNRLPGYIAEKISVDPNRGCWLWEGQINRNGYGRFRRNGHRFMTHIFVFDIYKGPIRAGNVVDHLCEVRNCCNPAHLEQVPEIKNLNRRYRRRKGITADGKLTTAK